MAENTKLRIAAISDIHVKKTSAGSLQPLFAEVSQNADVLVMGGDLTNYGLPEEAQVLAQEIKACTVPKLAILGNHDHESGQPDEVRKILKAGGIVFVDEEPYTLNHVGFAGVKGFGGGFGQLLLEYFGEAETKAYVQATLDEVKRLEVSLSSISRAEKKVVLLHYSPIVATIEGEPPEIFPFLGSTRFEEVIDRVGVDLVFHGHAHYGSPEGKTGKGALVYNVAMPLMQKVGEKKGYRIVKI